MNASAVSSNAPQSSLANRSFSGRTALFGCLVGCLLGALAFAGALALLPKGYVARAVVQLRTVRPPGEGAVKSEVSYPDRIRELFVAEETLGPVVQQFGLERLWGVEGSEAAKRIGREVRVDWARGRDVYAVTYQHRDPHMASAIVNALVESCQERLREVGAKSGAGGELSAMPVIVMEKAFPGSKGWNDPGSPDLLRAVLFYMTAGGAIGLIVSLPVWRRKAGRSG